MAAEDCLGSLIFIPDDRAHLGIVGAFPAKLDFAAPCGAAIALSTRAADLACETDRTMAFSVLVAECC